MRCDARFQARLGTYALVWHRNKVTKAVNYVGLQMSQTVLGFVMFFMVWTPLIFAVQYARCARVLRAFTRCAWRVARN